MKISVIIPVINEAENLRNLLPILTQGAVAEIIMADGGSNDTSVAVAESFGVKVIPVQKGRARQMNAGARAAVGDILYFVHADSIPPVSFAEDILGAVSPKTPFGCFRSLFNTKSWFLRKNSYFSRFKGMMFRGGGQTLWITKELFQQLNGYDESRKLMEEYCLIKRATKIADYKVIQKDILVSARTYEENGNFKTQLVYGLVMFGFFRGFNQDKLIQFTRRWLK